LRQYLNLLAKVQEMGIYTPDRTGTGTFSIFGTQMRFDLQEGFPLLTTKKMAFKSVVSELLWFLEGSTDERRLAEIHYGKPRSELTGKRTIWTDNAENQGRALGYAEGMLGPIYGSQWRDWNQSFDGGANLEREEWVQFDQIAKLIEDIKVNPYSRRHILSAWNVSDLHYMALPPCHVLSQFFVRDGKLSCHLYQRSADMFLGVPFNIASYALLTHMIAQCTGLDVGEFIWSGGDCHIYENHLEAVNEQLDRKPYAPCYLRLKNGVKNIDDFKMKDFELAGYVHWPAIKGKMAI
jgi:thymidylate synthase